MSFSFNHQRGLIHVSAELDTPRGTLRLLLALDTGATETMIDLDILLRAGYSLSHALRSVQVATAGGVVSAPLLVITRIGALGLDRFYLPVVGHPVPHNI